MDIFRIRFWPFVADTFVDLALYGHAYICGDILYASVYLATGKHVKHTCLDPADCDQSIRDLYRYPEGARRIHHFRMELEIYFGVPPLFFVRSDSAGIELGKDHIRQMVERYRQSWKTCPLPPTRISQAALQQMVCHDGQWYANSHEGSGANGTYVRWAVIMDRNEFVGVCTGCVQGTAFRPRGHRSVRPVVSELQTELARPR